MRRVGKGSGVAPSQPPAARPPAWEELFVAQARSWVFGDGDLAQVGRYLLVALGTSSRFLLAHLTDKQAIGTVVSGMIGDVRVSVAARPAGTIPVEELIRALPFTPAEVVIGVGAAGGIGRGLCIGDIVIPTEAARGEGLTPYYYPAEVPALPDPAVLEALRAAASKPAEPWHCGPVYTAGTLLHETADLLARWQEQGYLAVECEGAALFLVSRYCRLRAGLVLYISDEPLAARLHTGSHDLRVRWLAAQERAARIAVAAVGLLAHQG